MKKQRKPESFIRQPNYPGGKNAMDEFVRQNMRYPQEAMDNKVEGIVSIEYDIDVFGDVIEARIKHGIGYGCDEEAVRLIKMMKFEKKKYQGLRVVFHKTTHIHFRLTTNPLPEQTQQLNFQYTEKPKTEKPKAENPITYSIRLNNDDQLPN